MGVTYKTRCAKCGYNKEFKLGVGFFGLEVPERAERDILSGRLGGEIKKFYSACKSPRVLGGRCTAVRIAAICRISPKLSYKTRTARNTYTNTFVLSAERQNS